MTKKEIRFNVPVNWFCDQKCLFCGEEDKSEYSFMKGNEDKYVYELIDYGIKNHNSIMFTTGEPVLNKNLNLYIEYAKKIGYKKICLITNGVKLFDDELRKKIINAGVSEITFSIHGSNSRIHDFNTKTKGSFEKSLLSLIKLRKENKNIEIYTNFVLNKSNFNDLYNYIYKFFKLGVNKILIHNMRPDGYGKIEMKHLSIRYTELIKYFVGLGEEKKLFINELIKKDFLLIKDIPTCVLEKSGINIKHEEIIEKMETVNKGKIGIIDFSEDKIYLDICNDCEFVNNCNGVYKDYIDIFGEEEFYKI